MDPPTIKGLARLLSQSLKNGAIYPFCTSADIVNLQSGSVRTMKDIFKKANLTRFVNQPLEMINMQKMQKIIEDTSPECFARFIAFNIFGDRISTDIDIVLKVDNLDRPLLSSEVSRLHYELQELGYDVNRGLDINKVFIDSNGFIKFSKGGNETINMLIFTYGLHTQAYPLIFTEKVELDIYQKVHSMCTFIANKLETLTSSSDYEILRVEKRTVYTFGGLERIDFAMKCMDYFANNIGGYRDYDVWKSLTLKYLQLILFDKATCDCFETNRSYYQKLDIVELYRLYNLDTNPNIDVNMLESLLTRKPFETVEEETRFKKIIEQLHIQVKKIINDNLPRLEWTIQKIQHTQFNEMVSSCNTISQSLFSEWMSSPINVSDAFCDTWFSDYGDGNLAINDKFIEKNENLMCLDSHQNVKEHVINVEQRSDEWKKLIKFYSCGNNTGISEIASSNQSDILKGRSNLIMGCIGETIIAKYFDESKLVQIGKMFEKCTIGLLVETVGQEGSNGSCPDQLFVSDKEIIPAEFKTINGRPSENRGYCREFSLAKKQLTRCANILNICEERVCTRGIMVFLWIYQDDGEWIYEMRGGLVHNL